MPPQSLQLFRTETLIFCYIGVGLANETNQQNTYKYTSYKLYNRIHTTDRHFWTCSSKLFVSTKYVDCGKTHLKFDYYCLDNFLNEKLLGITKSLHHFAEIY